MPKRWDTKGRSSLLTPVSSAAPSPDGTSTGPAVLDINTGETFGDGEGAITILEGQFDTSSSDRTVYVAQFRLSGLLTNITAAGTLTADLLRNGVSLLSASSTEDTFPLTDRHFSVEADLVFSTFGGDGLVTGNLMILSSETAGVAAFNQTVRTIRIPFTTFADTGVRTTISLTLESVNAGGATTYDDVSGYLLLLNGEDGSDTNT